MLIATMQAKDIDCLDLFQTIHNKHDQFWQPTHLASKIGGHIAPQMLYKKIVNKPNQSIFVHQFYICVITGAPL